MQGADEAEKEHSYGAEGYYNLNPEFLLGERYDLKLSSVLQLRLGTR